MFKGIGIVKSVLSVFMDSIEDENEFLVAWNDENEFLVAWNNMLDKYDAHDNSWLKSVYELR